MKGKLVKCNFLTKHCSTQLEKMPSATSNTCYIKAVHFVKVQPAEERAALILSLAHSWSGNLAAMGT